MTPLAPTGPPAPAARPVSAAGRVLLIEDEPALRAVFVEALRLSGYEVDEADGGHEALRRIDAGTPPTIVITDLAMPGVGGWAVIEAARRRNPAVGAIVITGWEERADVERARREGVCLLLKPFGLRELLDAVRRLRPAPDATPAV